MIKIFTLVNSNHLSFNAYNFRKYGHGQTYRGSHVMFLHVNRVLISFVSSSPTIT